MKKYPRTRRHKVEWDFVIEDCESAFSDDEKEFVDDEYSDKEVHTLNDFLEHLEWLSKSTDHEGAHIDADRVLLDIIRHMATNVALPKGDAETLLAIIDSFKSIHKWYV